MENSAVILNNYIIVYYKYANNHLDSSSSFLSPFFYKYYCSISRLSSVVYLCSYYLYVFSFA